MYRKRILIIDRPFITSFIKLYKVQDRVKVCLIYLPKSMPNETLTECDKFNFNFYNEYNTI